MYNDVFISYRRDTGPYLSKLVKKELNDRNVTCFYDTDSIHNEDFLIKIERGIDSAPNFIGILTPGYFVKRVEKEDYVRAELKMALEKGKNIIFIMADGFDHDEIDWDSEPEWMQKIGRINTNALHTDIGEDMMEAFFSKIVGMLQDKNGKKLSFSEKPVDNSWYGEFGMSDEDMIWILTDHDVNKSLDWELLGSIVNEDVFKGKKKLNLLSFKAYDISSYADKYDITKFKYCEDTDKSISVYGITYESMLKEADSCFGEGHFLSDVEADDEHSRHDGMLGQIRKLLKSNGLKGFDIIDLTLVVKDTDNPEKTVRDVAQFLNPGGGIIYIRELDDDYLDAYPDEGKYIKRMKEYLKLDRGAGYRHCGKKVLSFLKRAGADKVVMSARVVSTANHKAKYNEKLCETYFSYLLPELRNLSKPTEKNKEDRNYSKYQEAYEWLEEHYDEVKSLFRSPEFYFRAGYVAGYGIFESEEDEE